jgi:hypothetical protein
MYIKDKGIVISSYLYRNTSQLAKVFFRTNGYLLCYAKGIYKIKKLDFDGPFHSFFEYEIEIHSAFEYTDVVLVTSSKCIKGITYNNFNKIKFLSNIQNFIEEFFVYGYKDKRQYDFLHDFIGIVERIQNLKFIHYAYFVSHTLFLMGLLSVHTLQNMNITPRLSSFIKYLLTTRSLEKTSVEVESQIKREFGQFIKNNFRHYYNKNLMFGGVNI